MECARSLHEVDCGRSVLRYSGAVLLSAAIVVWLAACGGGGADSSGVPPGTSGGVLSGTNTAMLEWDAVTDPNLSGYRVYVGIASGTYLQSIDAGTATTYTVTGIGSGTYYFAATAYDMSNMESAFSIEIFKTFP